MACDPTRPAPVRPALTHVLYILLLSRARMHSEGSMYKGRARGRSDVQGSTVYSSGQSWCRGEADADRGSAPERGCCRAL